MTSSKFNETQVSKQQAVGTGTLGAYLPEFLSSLLALAFWRGNNFAEGNAAAIKMARRERRLRPLPYCIGLVLSCGSGALPGPAASGADTGSSQAQV